MQHVGFSSPQLGIEPTYPELEAQSFNQWLPGKSVIFPLIFSFHP